MTSHPLTSVVVIDLDQFIRRVLQEHVYKKQPPLVVWGNIQRHTARKKALKRDHQRYEFGGDATNPRHHA